MFLLDLKDTAALINEHSKRNVYFQAVTLM